MTGRRRRAAGWRAVWAVVVLAVVAWGAARLLPPRVAVVRVARGELVETVVATGRVMAPARVTIGALVSGTVARLLTEEGRRARAGELLLALDAAEAQGAVQQARGALAQAAARLEQVQQVEGPLAGEALAQARTNVEQAEAQFRRVDRLARDGLVTEAQLDDARKVLERAHSQYEGARIQQAGAGRQGVEERLARAALDQARGALAAAESRLAHTCITAPTDGVIIDRRVEAGDLVQAGQTLLLLAADGATRITVTPDEKNLASLRLGQTALVSAEAFPQQKFPATLSFVAPAVDAERGTIEIRLTVPDPPPYLRADMTVSVEVEVARRAGVLVLPLDAVRDATTAPWVLVADHGRVARREVRLGARGTLTTEVTAGLSEGDAVIPPSAGPVGERSRVWVVAAEGGQRPPQSKRPSETGIEAPAGPGTGKRRAV